MEDLEVVTLALKIADPKAAPLLQMKCRYTTPVLFSACDSGMDLQYLVYVDNAMKFGGNSCTSTFVGGGNLSSGVSL